MNILTFKRLNPDVEIPSYGTSMSTCFDLTFCPSGFIVSGYDINNVQVVRNLNHSNRSVAIYPGDRLLLPTGLIMKIEPSQYGSSAPPLYTYSIRLHARSGLSLKRGLVLANSEGVVDVDYQKEIFVVMTNISSVVQMIEFKERIAQAEIVNNIPFRLHETSADIEPYSERDGGFGSTGRI